MNGVDRHISAFDKKTEFLAHQQRVEDRHYPALAEWCGPKENDPMHTYCYPIEKSDEVFFTRILPTHFKFDFDSFDYFLEATQE